MGRGVQRSSAEIIADQKKKYIKNIIISFFGYILAIPSLKGVQFIEPMTIIYTQDEFKRAKQNLFTYYNVCERDIDAVAIPSEKGVIELPSLIGEQLIAVYMPLGATETDDELLQTLHLLVFCVKQKNDIIGSSDDKRICDILKLSLLCSGTKDGDSIIVKNRARCFRLDNRYNWLIDELVRPFCEKIIGEDRSTSDIENELKLMLRHQRGRRYRDPRVPVLLWGTYRLLTDKHGFRTPMPNRLCTFLIELLKIMKVFPLNTEVDELWIRAQLRYIKTKKDISSDR